MTDTHRPVDERARHESAHGRDLAPTVSEALIGKNWQQVAALIKPLHAADLADLVEELSAEGRGRLLEFTRGHLNPETLTHLHDAVRVQVMDKLDSSEVAAAITELEADDAIDIIEDLKPQERAAILEQLSLSDRAILEEGLAYPSDSAGRLMQRQLVTVPESWCVGDTIDYMRTRTASLPRDFYDIFVVDAGRKPIGVVPLSRLMRNQRLVHVHDIMATEMTRIAADMDQEDVAFLFQQYGLVSAPVIDDADRLIGVITVDDVVHVVQDEAEEDIMHLGGVMEDDFYDAVLKTMRRRFSWLLANLATAIAASVVIGLFDAAIERVVALAILMPIVASMGGNAGTQTLTVAVRALAMKELTASNALRIVGKEVLVGGINGVAFAAVMGLIAWIWFDDPVIGAVIGTAMVINLLVAGFAGVVIPLALERWGADPAVGSTVVLTTITDVVGFLSFLGLGSLIFL